MWRTRRDSNPPPARFVAVGTVQLCYGCVEPSARIELAFPLYQSGVLPLDYDGKEILLNRSAIDGHSPHPVFSFSRWRIRELNPSRVACKASLRPSGSPFTICAPDWNRTSFSAFSEPRTNRVCYRGIAPATRIGLARSAVTGQRPHQWTSQAIWVTEGNRTPEHWFHKPAAAPATFSNPSQCALRDSNPRSPVIGRMSFHWTKGA